MRLLLLVALGAFAAFGVAGAEPGAPLFMGLGDLPGGSFYSEPWAVSADGSTVVGKSNGASGEEAFIWTNGGGMLGLGANTWDAMDVSADGSTVVGWEKTRYEAFRWTSGGGMEYFGGPYSVATGVSADGSTVAGLAGDEAFIWTSEGGVMGLGTLPGGHLPSEAWDVSADGSTVVGWSRNASSDYEAFIWTSESGMVGLGDLSGGNFNSRARAVSADASTVVGKGSSEPGYEAFRWTSSGGMVGLGIYGEAWGASADGSTLVGLAGGEAFIWDSTNGMRELDEVLTHLGVDLTGWTLSGARDISANGRVIVGYGTNPGGDTEAWIAVLPIPVPAFQPPGLVGLASLLLGFGFIGLAAGKRRR